MGLIFSRKRKKKKQDRIEAIRKKTLSKIRVFNESFSEQNPEDTSIQFFHIIRGFFAEFFRLKYQFTLDELEADLKRKRVDNDLKEKISLFLKKLTVIGFSEIKITKQELMQLQNYFLYLFDKITFIEDQKPKGFFKSIAENISRKLRIYRHSKKEPFFQSLFRSLSLGAKSASVFLSPKEMRSRIEKKKSSRQLDNLQSLMINAYEHLSKGRLEQSKKAYADIKHAYNALNDEDKEHIYEEIVSLYNEIVSNYENTPKVK